MYFNRMPVKYFGLSTHTIILRANGFISSILMLIFKIIISLARTTNLILDKNVEKNYFNKQFESVLTLE